MTRKFFQSYPMTYAINKMNVCYVKILIVNMFQINPLMQLDFALNIQSCVINMIHNNKVALEYYQNKMNEIYIK